MLGVLPELYALRPAELYPLHALRVARRVVGADKADWTEVDLRTGDFRVLIDPQPDVVADLVDARRAYMSEHPVLAHFLTSPFPKPRAISDFLTRREFQRLSLYGEFFAFVGVEDQLTARVRPLESGHGAAISLDRDCRSFDERDWLLLNALQPHIAVGLENATRFSGMLASEWPLGALDRARLERLTDRQLDVLARIAAGDTNAQIALELDISVGTVRKHVEHILRRLETSTRTAAAAQFIAATRCPVDDAPWTASEPQMLTTA